MSYAITWMNLEDIMLGEISQSQKSKVVSDSTNVRHNWIVKTHRSRKEHGGWLPGAIRREK